MIYSFLFTLLPDHFCGKNRMINGNGKWPEEDWVIVKKEKENAKTWCFMNQKISSRISKWNLFRVVLSSYAAFNIFHPSCSAILQLLASITQWSTNKTSSPFLCFTYVWMILKRLINSFYSDLFLHIKL